MLRLLDVVIDSKYSFSDKITFLKSCSNTGTFKDDDVESIGLVSKKIKSLLSATTGRTEGMLLLQIFMEECSTEVFVENAVSWANLTLKVLKATENVEDKQLACMVFRQLIPLLPSFPAVWKQVSGSVVTSLLEAIMRVSPEDEWAEDAFELLVCCLKTFPGSFGSQKVSIETFILKHLGEWSQPVLKILASCISLLPWSSGGGVHGANHSTAWSTQLDNMLSSLDRILDHLYNDADIYEDGSPLLLSSLELPLLSVSDPLLSVFRIHRHFQFLGLCVQLMLSDEHSTVVKVPFDDLLSFIWKALSVNSIEVLEKPSLDATAVASVIPAVHCMALSILETLICGFRRQLAVHAHTINNILLQSLVWTSKDECSYGTEKAYSGIRVQTYQVLQVWMDCLGSLSDVHGQGEEFINHFLSDLKVEQDCVQLLSPSEVDRPRGRKRKRKQGETLAGSMNSQRKANVLANRELCLHALRALKSALYSSGSLLEIDLHKKIHGTVLQLLADVQQQSQNADPSSLSIPYWSPNCRQELYAVLLACVLCPHPQWPPPLQPAVTLFKRGQLDHSLEVSSFCCEGLAVLNVVIHPRVTVLQYVEQQIESQVLHPLRNRASSIIDEAVHHTQHSRLMADEKDEMDFAASYSQEITSNSSLKRKRAWNAEEQSIVPEPQRPAEKVPPTLPPPPPPAPQPQQLSATVVSVTAAPPAHQPQQATSLQTTAETVAPPKPSRPADVPQQHKPHLPKPVSTLHQQPQNGASRKPSRMQRGSDRASEEVVLLSEEESAEDNHMEDGGEEEEEEDEDEDEAEEEEEEEEYYPEEDEEEGVFEGHLTADGYIRRDKSPSLVLTGGRSTEDSSSTGHAVSSIVGSLVTETASTTVVMPVQKARRTGVLARTEIALKEMEERKMNEMARQQLEDEELEYEGEEEAYDEEEEEEEGLERGECDEDQDDIEEIHEIDDQEEEDQPQYEKWQEVTEDDDMHDASVLIPDNSVAEELVPKEADSTELEDQNITVLQPLQITAVEHSTEILPSENHEPQIISSTSISESALSEEADKKEELEKVDSDSASKSQEQAGETDSDVIEISDSPIKEIQASNRVDAAGSDTDNMDSEFVIVQRFTDADEESDVVQVAEITDGIQNEYKAESQGEEGDGEEMEVEEEPVTSYDGTESNEGQSLSNDVQTETKKSSTKEHSNGEAQKSVKDLNHSVVETSNCASVEYEDDKNETVSGDSTELRAHIRVVPDSPEEPAAKKLCMLMRDKEEEPEPDEESPPLDDMINNFVCCVREND